MIANEAKKEQTVDVELRRELSDFLAQRFMCKKNCSMCWNTGVRVMRRLTYGELQYLPCTCLVLIKKDKDDKKDIGPKA